MSNPPVIPERISSLMPPNRQLALSQQRLRSTSAMTRVSQMSSNSAVSEFLEAKFSTMQAELDWIRCATDGLNEAKAQSLLTDTEFVEELQPILDAFRKTTKTLTVHKRHERTLEDDLDEQTATKRQRTAGEEPDPDFLHRAYASTMVSRVMAASAKQRVTKFDQSKFKREVIKYYTPEENIRTEHVWCHILGKWVYHKGVKAAHIVPKSLSGDELAHLFGVGEILLEDPRNGITLLSALEERLDQGVIAIVPMSGGFEVPTRWKCILIDESKAKNFIWDAPPTQSHELIHLGDLDGKELEFLTDNRPARRFLYFRFVISYLYAKRKGTITITDKVGKTKFWPTIGRYLNRSTLVTLARCISGCELPQSIIEGQTFEPKDMDDHQRSKDAGLILAADMQDTVVKGNLRDQIVEGIKKLEVYGAGNDESSDSEDY
ncbi:hypothetical protein BJX76DRAFT_3880 [Aspergillus varians]